MGNRIILSVMIIVAILCVVACDRGGSDVAPQTYITTLETEYLTNSGSASFTGYVDVSGTPAFATGRGATTFVACSDATAIEKAQADILLDGTDDHLDIITAIGYGGKTQVSSGNVVCSGTITLPSGIGIDGMYDATAFVPAAGYEGPIFYSNNKGDITLENFKITALGTSGTITTGIMMEDPDIHNLNNLIVEYCVVGIEVNDNGTSGGRASKIMNCDISHNEFGAYLGRTVTADYTEITDSTFIGNTDHAIYIATGKNITIADNTLFANFRGILDGDGITKAYRNKITNNDINHCTEYGLKTWGNASIIADNDIVSNGHQGVWISRMVGGSFTNNRISANGSTGTPTVSAQCDIFLDHQNDLLSMVGNQIGSGGTYPDALVYVDVANRVNLVSNQFDVGAGKDIFAYASPSAKPKFYMVEGNMSLNEITAHTANASLESWECQGVHTNLGASGVITMTLDRRNRAGGTPFNFIVSASEEFRLDPAVGALYVNGAKQTDGKYISSSTIGDTATIWYDDSIQDYYVECEGNWSVEDGSLLFGQDYTTELVTITGEMAIDSDAGETPMAITVGGTTVATIWPKGHFQNADGLRTVSAKYGPSLLSHDWGDGTPEHTNGVGSYDHTGGAYENLFTATAGDVFTTADAGDGQMNSWILMTGENLGAFAEITTFVSTTQVIVEGLGWDTDIASQGFYIYKHPTFITGDGHRTDISTNSDGELLIHSIDYTEENVVKIEADAGADGPMYGFKVASEANGYNLITGARINYLTGDLAAGDVGGGLFVTIDDTDDLAQTATTILGGIAVQSTNSGTAINRSFVSIGADEHFVAVGNEPIEPDYGYRVASGAVTDRVNGAGTGTAFIDAAQNIQLFESDNDYVLYGNDDKFEMLDIVLTIGANVNIREDVEYSTGAGAWTTLPLQSDTMKGWRQSGGYIWDAPGNWVEVSQAEGVGDISEGYYIKVSRTRNTVLTVPTEEICDIHLDSSGDTGMKIKANGVVRLPVLTGISADVENGDIWMEADGLHIYYNGAEKLVAGV